MKCKFLIVVLLVLLITNISFAQNEKVKKEIRLKMETLKTALIAKDSVALSKVLADDVTYGHTNAMIQTKSELIRDVVSLVQDYTNIETKDEQIRKYGKTAIVNLKAIITLNYHKEPMTLKMKMVLVWVKKKGDWLLEARQAVKIVD